MLDLGFGAWDLNKIFTVYYLYQFMTICQIFRKLVLAKKNWEKGAPPRNLLLVKINLQQTTSNFIDKFQVSSKNVVLIESYDLLNLSGNMKLVIKKLKGHNF